MFSVPRILRTSDLLLGTVVSNQVDDSVTPFALSIVVLNVLCAVTVWRVRERARLRASLAPVVAG